MRIKYVKPKIESVLVEYIRNECLSKGSSETITNEKNLFEAGIIDSAGLISFISFVESEFGITIPDDDLLPENFSTIKAIADYIRYRQKKANKRTMAESRIWQL